MALTDKLTAIGSAIRNKTGSTELLTLDEMPTAISNIQTGSGGGSVTDFIPEKEFTITGTCDYKFSYDNWNWFIEKYGNRITTNNLTCESSMFYFAKNLKKIPFDINYKSNSKYSWNNMFRDCQNLTEIQNISGQPSNMSYFFYNCYRLRNLPENFGENINWNTIHTNANSTLACVFTNCYSLRNIPASFLNEFYNKNMGSNTWMYGQTFSNCYSLDEITGFPNIPVTSTYSLMSDTFKSCSRLKSLTFALQGDGTPQIMSWKNCTCDLTNYIGYASNSSYILNYNSGITADKQVTDDTTYQALKDDPDWFTTNIAYSRYNHDSAVATINSLPNTSAYLAEKGGTNTIKFKGASGSSTDGGAINTLTEEEIAVSTAKGWTVALV